MTDQNTQHNLIGPKAGERWTIGKVTGLTFLGMSRDYVYDCKHFIFKDVNGELLSITKDDFFDADIPKSREFDHYALTSYEPLVSCYGTSFKSVEEAHREAAMLRRDFGLCAGYVIGGLTVGVGWTTVFDGRKEQIPGHAD